MAVWKETLNLPDFPKEPSILPGIASLSGHLQQKGLYVNHYDLHHSSGELRAIVPVPCC